MRGVRPDHDRAMRSGRRHLKPARATGPRARAARRPSRRRRRHARPAIFSRGGLTRCNVYRYHSMMARQKKPPHEKYRQAAITFRPGQLELVDSLVSRTPGLNRSMAIQDALDHYLAAPSGSSRSRRGRKRPATADRTGRAQVLPLRGPGDMRAIALKLRELETKVESLAERRERDSNPR